MACFVSLPGWRDELALFTDSQARLLRTSSCAWTELNTLDRGLLLNTDVVMINSSSHQRCTWFCIRIVIISYYV